LGLKLFDERGQTWHDYTHRKPGEAIVFADTIAPPNSPAWATDPARLWNRVEQAEKRKDSQVARDYRIPIPRGVTDAQAADMALMMARFIMEQLHTPVSYAVHRDAALDAFGKVKPNEKQGFHAHLYFPTRGLIAITGDDGEEDGEGGDGFGPKLKQFVNQAAGSAMTERLNVRWAEVANIVAGQHGLATGYDHRSYKRQGLTRRPEPKLGQAATAMERRGIRTARGDALRAHRQMRDDIDGASHSGAVPPALTHPWPQAPIDGIAMPASAVTVLPQPRPALPPRPAEGWRRAVVTPLTAAMRLESPTAYEPPPISGLADRFQASTQRGASKRAPAPSPRILVLVRAIESALNALVTVARALMHLKNDHRRHLAKLLEVRHEADLQRQHRDRLRRDDATARPPNTPRLSSAHRKRLAEILTVDEEIAEKQRVAASLETQLSELGQRMNPWEKQAIDDRQQVKHHLGELLKEGPEHVEQLLAVANEDEAPWLKLYSARKEPMLALQNAVNEQEGNGANTAYVRKPAPRPSI
jgi:hypothetical protein